MKAFPFLAIAFGAIGMSPAAAQSVGDAAAYYALVSAPQGAVPPILSEPMLDRVMRSMDVALRYGHVSLDGGSLNSYDVRLGWPLGTNAMFGLNAGYLDLSCGGSCDGHIMAGAKTFGFHGIFNLFLVEPMEQIEAVAARMSDQTARLDTLHLLLQNFANFGLWEGAVALGRRILSASPENTTVAEIVVHASEQMARRSASPNRYPYPRFLRRITQLIRSTR